MPSRHPLPAAAIATTRAGKGDRRLTAAAADEPHGRQQVSAEPEPDGRARPGPGAPHPGLRRRLGARRRGRGRRQGLLRLRRALLFRPRGTRPLPPSLLDCIVCLFFFSCPPFIQGSVRLVYDLCYFRCFKLSYILLTVMFVNGMNRGAVYVLGNASMSYLGLVAKWY